MKKICCLLLVFGLVFSCALPVNAAGVSDWIELLETATVDDNGHNVVTLKASSDFFRIKTPMYMRVTKVDIIISHASGYSPKFLKVKYNNGYYTLTKAVLDANTTRFYGENIPDTLYADLVFEIAQNGSSTVYYQVLSCKVTSLTASTYNAQAVCNIESNQYDIPFNIDVPHDPEATDVYDHFQFSVFVEDWQKYDKLVISGSIGSLALNGIRASIGGLGLPYTMTYAVTNTSGGNGKDYTWNEMKYYTYDESYKGTSENTSFFYIDYWGKVLFTITIDLAGVDRTIVGEPLKIYFTTLKSDYQGYTMQFLGVVGTVTVADTTNANWWTWGKGIKANLEQLPKKIAEELSKLYKPDAGKIESAQQQSQELAEDRLGAVAQAGQVVDGLVGAFQNQSATEYLTVPVLTVPLGEVNWTIGGWNVQVVPDVFKPIVETLKLVIDIVCTLAFLQAMRSRLERMLSGGNA